MKKLLSLVLTLCLAASLAACSGDSADTTAAEKDTAAATEAETDATTDAETEAETEAATEEVTDAETEAPAEDETSIYGTWKANLDLSKVMNESFAASAPGITLPEVTGFAVEFIFQLNEDGTGKIVFTEEAVNAAITNATPSIKAAIEALYTAMAQQMNMTLEELLAASEITIDELVAQMAESFQGMATESEGTFLIEGDKLYTEANENGEFDKTQYIVFTLEGGKLTFTELVAGDESSMAVLKSVTPIVFEKQ